MVTEDTAQSSGSNSGRQVELSAGAAVDATRSNKSAIERHEYYVVSKPCICYLVWTQFLVAYSTSVRREALPDWICRR